MHIRLLASILCVCMAVSISRADDLALVIDGQSVGEIILPPQPSPAEEFVANDFQHWVAQITGATVPVLDSPSGKANVKVYVGKGLAARWRADLRTLEGTDGFAIRRSDNGIYVFGDHPRGTAYGMYHLLETSTDIIWARPAEEFGTVFTQTETLRLKGTDVVETPVFRLRGWNVVGVRGHQPTGVWVWRNRGNYADQTRTPQLEMLTLLGGGHAFFGTMAPPDQIDEQTGKTLFEAHPEYYGWDDSKGGRNPVTLCLTNKDLPEVSAQNIRNRIESLPSPPDYLWLGMRDTWAVCQCPDCRKPIRLSDGTQLAMRHPTAEQDPLFRSTQYFMFMNEVASALRQTYPDIRILTFGYLYSAEPPACELHEAILPLFCPVGNKNGRYPLDDPNQNPLWRARFSEWCNKYGGRLAIYEYYFGFSAPDISYGRIATSIAPDLRVLAHVKAEGLISELTPDVDAMFRVSMRRSWDTGAMDAWIVTRLLWDPYQDVNALRGYYLQRTYHEAAPAMGRFYDLLEQGWASSTSSQKSRSRAFEIHIVDQGNEDACLAALNEAEKLATHPHAQKMIARLKAEWFSIANSLGRNIVPAFSAEDAHLAATEAQAVFWEDALQISDFRRARNWGWGARTQAKAGTEIRAMHDGQNLYLRTMVDGGEPGPLVLMPPARPDVWPKSDRVELYLRNSSGLYLFAYDGNGNHYDAKDYDRRWQSGWTVKAHKSERGWTALLVIPLASLQYKPNSAESELSIFIMRHAVTPTYTEDSTLRGGILGQRGTFPLIFK